MGPVGETRGRSRGARPGRGCGDPGTKRRPELGALGSHPGGGIRSQGQRRGGGGPCACDCPPEGREAGAALLPAAVGRESLLSSRNPSRRRDTQAVTSAAVDLSPRGNLGTPFGSNSGGFVKWVLVQPEGWAVLQPSTSDLRGVWGSPLPCSPPPQPCWPLLTWARSQAPRRPGGRVGSRYVPAGSCPDPVLARLTAGHQQAP